MFEKVVINKFKNIDNMELVLGQINVLVGSNNAGKSSVLQAIQFAVSVAQTTSLENARWSGERLPTSISPTQLIYSPLKDVAALAPGGNLRELPEQAISISLCEAQTANIANISVRRGRNKNIVIAIEGMTLGKRLQMIEEPYSIYVPGLAGIPNVEEFKTSGFVRKAAARGDANSVFRNVLWLLKQDTTDWNQFVEDFQNIFPEMSIDVNFEATRDEFINATIQMGNDRLPIDAAGTGVLQVIQILSYVNVYKPQLLILDEPDSHLHPNNQRKLTLMLVALAAKRNFQVLISTHSRYLIEELSGIAKMHWIRNGKVVEVEDFDEVNLLMDIGALDKGDLLLQGSVKCVLLTEDSNSEAISTLLHASGFKMEEVDVWPYKGCIKAGAALVLAAFIRKYVPSTVIIVHRDRDYLTDGDIACFKAKIEQYYIRCFVTKGTDAESHFLSAEHINSLLPIIPIERAIELLNIVTIEAEEKSKRKIISSKLRINAQECRETSREQDPGKARWRPIEHMSLIKNDFVMGKRYLIDLNQNFKRRSVVTSTCLDPLNL